MTIRNIINSLRCRARVLIPRCVSFCVSSKYGIEGASAIQCCYAAIEMRESSTLTNMVESKNTSVMFCSAKKLIVEEKISLNVSRTAVNSACMAGVRTSRPNQRPVRPDEVVIAANQLEVIFEALLPSRMANRPPR